MTEKYDGVFIPANQLKILKWSVQTLNITWDNVYAYIYIYIYIYTYRMK